MELQSQVNQRLQRRSNATGIPIITQTRRVAPAITRLPRLRGATCMTLGGTDKKGGS